MFASVIYIQVLFIKLNYRGGVEDTRLEAKDTKKFRGQGQGLQNVSSRPRTSSRTPPLEIGTTNLIVHMEITSYKATSFSVNYIFIYISSQIHTNAALSFIGVAGGGGGRPPNRNATNDKKCIVFSASFSIFACYNKLHYSN